MSRHPLRTALTTAAVVPAPDVGSRLLVRDRAEA